MAEQTNEKQIIIEKLFSIYIILQEETSNDLGLLDGIAGKVLFSYHYEKWLNNGENSLTERYIQELFNGIENATYSSISYSTGLAGINFSLKYLNKNELFDNEDSAYIETMTTQLDNLLLHNLNKQILANCTDFLHGELGIVWQMLNNEVVYTSSLFQKYLQRLIDSLNIDKNGYFYYPANTKKGYTSVINMGLSHGLPAGLIIFSSGISDKEYSKILVSKIKDYVTYNKLDGKSLYPVAIIDNKAKYEPRYSWCYGDLGIAVSFWTAGNSLDICEWKIEAEEILLHGLKHNNEAQNGIRDACFCHGTSGIAHIFNKMYYRTKNPIFKETASYWINETLKMAKFEDGLAGFKTWRGDENEWVNDSGLLEGIAGIGLALLSHISDENPTWDRCLLLSYKQRTFYCEKLPAIHHISSS